MFNRLCGALSGASALTSKCRTRWLILRQMAVALEAALAIVLCPLSPPCILGPGNNLTEPPQCQTMSQRLLSDHRMLRQLHRLRHLVTHLLESDMGEHAIVTSLSGLLVIAPVVTFPTGILDLSNPSASVVPVPCVDTARSMVDTGVTSGLRSLNEYMGAILCENCQRFWD